MIAILTWLSGLTEFQGREHEIFGGVHDLHVVLVGARCGDHVSHLFDDVHVGRVDVPVRVGDRVLTTTTLTTVDRPGSLEAYIYVPVEKSAQLKMNLPVQIVDGSGNMLATSRITFISPQVDTATQTVLAKATIANSKDSLRTAQFIRARVIWGSHEKPVVPVVAVSRIGGLYFAFVAEADQKGGYVAHQKPLQIGQIVGNNYVVLDGVKPGDKVVVSGTQFLIDGVPVVPQESSS